MHLDANSRLSLRFGAFTSFFENRYGSQGQKTLEDAMEQNVGNLHPTVNHPLGIYNN